MTGLSNASMEGHRHECPGKCQPGETDAHLSAVIDVLRFPLVSLVVLYHAFNCSVTLLAGAYDWHQPATDFVYWKLLHDSIARSAVPLFFALSGYLYFRRTVLSWKTWCRKTWKRILRLWIPLWTWACLSLLFLWILHACGLPNGRAQNLFGTSHPPAWWIDGFLGLQSVPGPHFFPAGWFVRDLFFVGLLSPFWNVLLRRKIPALATLAILYGLYLTVFAPLPFLGSRAMFFFCLGAVYAIHRRDFASDAEKVAVPCAVFWGTGFVAGLFGQVPFVSALTTTSLVPVLVAVVSRGIRCKRFKPVAWLAASSFFVYFCHLSLWFQVPWDLLRMHLFTPCGDWACLCVILSNWVAGTFLPLGAFLVLRRFLPISLFVLCGITRDKSR